MQHEIFAIYDTCTCTYSFGRTIHIHTCVHVYIVSWCMCTCNWFRILPQPQQVDSKGQNFLHLAVINGDVEGLIFLLSVRADVNSKVQNPSLNTPLHYAVKSGNEILVRHLVSMHIQGFLKNTKIVAISRKYYIILTHVVSILFHSKIWMSSTLCKMLSIRCIHVHDWLPLSHSPAVGGCKGDGYWQPPAHCAPHGSGGGFPYHPQHPAGECSRPWCHGWRWKQPWVFISVILIRASQVMLKHCYSGYVSPNCCLFELLW